MNRTTPIASTTVWHDGIAYDVSTINRTSSAALAMGAEYAETLVFELLPDGRRGKIIAQGSAPAHAIYFHQKVVKKIHERGADALTEEDMEAA